MDKGWKTIYNKTVLKLKYYEISIYPNSNDTYRLFIEENNGKDGESHFDVQAANLENMKDKALTLFAVYLNKKTTKIKTTVKELNELFDLEEN